MSAARRASRPTSQHRQGSEVTPMNWPNVATIARKDLTIMLTRRSLRIGLAGAAAGPGGPLLADHRARQHPRGPASQDAERVPLLLHDLHRGAARDPRVLQPGRREGRAEP